MKDGQEDWLQRVAGFCQPTYSSAQALQEYVIEFVLDCFYRLVQTFFLGHGCCGCCGNPFFYIGFPITMLFTSIYKACLTKKTYSKMIEDRNIGEKSATTWIKLFLCSRAAVVQAQLDIKEVKNCWRNRNCEKIDNFVLSSPV